MFAFLASISNDITVVPVTANYVIDTTQCTRYRVSHSRSGGEGPNPAVLRSDISETNAYMCDYKQKATQVMSWMPHTPNLNFSRHWQMYICICWYCTDLQKQPVVVSTMKWGNSSSRTAPLSSECRALFSQLYNLASGNTGSRQASNHWADWSQPHQRKTSEKDKLLK